MATKPKMGSDPLSWIKDSRLGKSGKQSKQELQGLPKKTGRPRTIFREISKSSQEGLREGWSRATFIIREELIEKVKALAYWERKEIKELIDEILGSYFKNKKVKPIKGGKIV